MIGKKMQDAINEQIKEELYSAYLYLSMAADFYNKGWDGMAHWMEVQSKEEEGHAMRFFKHIVERQGKVELKAIPTPPQEWASPLDAFKDALKHEEYITSKINDLVKLAKEENDYPAAIMLQWFVEEQVEEEGSVAKIVHMLEKIGDSGNGMVMLDVQLGKRE